MWVLVCLMLKVMGIVSVVASRRWVVVVVVMLVVVVVAVGVDGGEDWW